MIPIMTENRQVNNKHSIRLDEVTLMRCILAILIVFMHSFTCYNGGWPEPVGFKSIVIYKWLSRFSFAFTLQSFVFISGYLFEFQRITLKRSKGGEALIINKLKRLILPSVIFSTAYFFLFYEYKGTWDMVYNIINGCGHLWYLPMLFWCFVGGWLLEQVKVGDCWKLAFLMCLNVFFLKFSSLPMQLDRVPSFLFYFYLGCIVYKQSVKLKKSMSLDKIGFASIAFLVFFVTLRPVRDLLVINASHGRFLNGWMMMADKVCLLIYAVSGLMAFYFTSIYYTQRHTLKKSTIQLSSYCFGIYVFQQFILQILYYKTQLPVLVGPFWLPWIGFVITIIVSIFLSILMYKTKYGKRLLG